MWKYVAKPSLTTIILLLVVIFALDGLARGLHAIPPDKTMVAEKVAYVAGALFADFVKGLLLALGVWFVAYIAKKFRITQPDPAAKMIGTLLFWSAIVGAAYFLLVAAYLLVAALVYTHGIVAIAPTVSTSAVIGILIWAAGCGVRYFLIPSVRSP